MDKTELRKDPLTQEWTVFSEARAFAPETGPVTKEQYAESPFRGGMERYASHAIYQDGGEYGWQVRVVPNRLPIVRVEGDHIQNGDGFYEHLDGVGAHEVVIEDPGARRFEELSLVEATKVIGAWRARIEDLLRDKRLIVFSVVKAVGKAAGQTIGHSLSQIFALAIIPGALRRKLDSAREYYAAKKRSLFADLIEREQRQATRFVYENSGYLVFCPFAARSPFEMAIWPKQRGPDFHRLGGESLDYFADAMLVSLRKLNRALEDPAYQIVLTTAPARPPGGGSWQTLDNDFRWHVTITPKLYRGSAFEAGMGCAVNGVWPEVAADLLRQQEVQA